MLARLPAFALIWDTSRWPCRNSTRYSNKVPKDYTSHKLCQHVPKTSGMMVPGWYSSSVVLCLDLVWLYGWPIVNIWVWQSLTALKIWSVRTVFLIALRILHCMNMLGFCKLRISNEFSRNSYPPTNSSASVLPWRNRKQYELLTGSICLWDYSHLGQLPMLAPFLRSTACIRLGRECNVFVKVACVML